MLMGMGGDFGPEAAVATQAYYWNGQSWVQNVQPGVNISSLSRLRYFDPSVGDFRVSQAFYKQATYGEDPNMMLAAWAGGNGSAYQSYLSADATATVSDWNRARRLWSPGMRTPAESSQQVSGEQYASMAW